MRVYSITLLATTGVKTGRASSVMQGQVQCKTRNMYTSLSLDACKPTPNLLKFEEASNVSVTTANLQMSMVEVAMLGPSQDKRYTHPPKLYTVPHAERKLVPEQPRYCGRRWAAQGHACHAASRGAVPVGREAFCKSLSAGLGKIIRSHQGSLTYRYLFRRLCRALNGADHWKRLF